MRQKFKLTSKKRLIGLEFVEKLIREYGDYIDGDIIKTFEDINLGCGKTVDLLNQVRLQLLDADKNFHKCRQLYVTSDVLDILKKSDEFMQCKLNRYNQINSGICPLCEKKYPYPNRAGECYESHDLGDKDVLLTQVMGLDIYELKDNTRTSFNKHDVILHPRNTKCGQHRDDCPFFDENVQIYCNECQKKISEHTKRLSEFWKELNKMRQKNKKKEIYDSDLDKKLWSTSHLLNFFGKTKNENYD